MTEPFENLQEKCGIVAIFTPKPAKQLKISLLAAGGVQHRGQQGAGIAQYGGKKIVKFVGSGLLRDIFTPKITKKFDKKSIWTLIHCRYGTYGGYCEDNLQPCFITTSQGNQIAVVHNGEFVATDKMREVIKGKISPDASDTSLFTRLLAQSEGKNWEEKILNALAQIYGAYSLAICVNDQLYLARDPLGIRPLVIGKIQDGWIAASETHALDKVGIKVIREVKRGEVISIDKKGLKIIKKGFDTPGNFCDFEWAYFSKPNSRLPTYENKDDSISPQNWLSIALFRERCGEIVAKESPIKHASFVVGAPDSGVHVAMGYANALRLPYRQVIIRDHYDPNGNQRLFMRDDEKELIGKKVLGKLSLVPDPQIWKDTVVVVGEDSIVRGNVSSRLTQAIFALGAKEVHFIVGFPPVLYRCFLGVSMRTEAELVASSHHGIPKKIALSIGATSVRYISPKGFIRAKMQLSKLIDVKNQKEIFLRNMGCGGCLTGIYPVNQNGEFYNLQTASKEKNIIIPILPAVQSNL